MRYLPGKRLPLAVGRTYREDDQASEPGPDMHPPRPYINHLSCLFIIIRLKLTYIEAKISYFVMRYMCIGYILSKYIVIQRQNSISTNILQYFLFHVSKA